MIRIFLAVFAFALSPAALAQQHEHSSYAGFEAREIKSLSEADIEELRRGGGWGLALAAELNGVPGPAHLLELRDEIGLAPDQVEAIEAIFTEMQGEARAAGERLLLAEQAIELAFRSGNLNEDVLRSLIVEAETARAELRFIHLSRHLETPPLLTREQVATYNRLRGYGQASAPCASMPAGHDAEMWRLHNDCS
jgi:hypothetical protein